MQLTPYLNYDGTCEAAFRFYAEALGAEIEAMFTHATVPTGCEIPGDWGNRIMHARIRKGNAVLMGSDCPPGRYEKPQGAYVSLHVEDPAEADRLFQTLSEGGEIQMPIQQTFWAVRFGMFVDRYGIPWMINCEAQQSE